MKFNHLKYRWPALLGVITAIPLYVILPDSLTRDMGPHWVVPSIEVLLCLVLIINPAKLRNKSDDIRIVSIILIAAINLANIMNVIELVTLLVNGSKAGGKQLIFASFPIWVTNVIVFGLWYWELDRGGPYKRLTTPLKPDFQFPQMISGSTDWAPGFFDYLYTAFTNATAFSPTDTMPLSKWAKMLMMIQSMISLITVALVFSRAVNIL